MQARAAPTTTGATIFGCILLANSAAATFTESILYYFVHFLFLILQTKLCLKNSIQFAI